MKEENITFSGKEASVLDLDTIKKAIDNLTSNTPIEKFGTQLSHNCDEAELLKVLGVEKTTSEYNVGNYYGLPVFKKSWVPLGEIWLQDKDGKVIQKFNI